MSYKLFRFALIALMVSSLFVNVFAEGEGVPNEIILNNSACPHSATTNYQNYNSSSEIWNVVEAVSYTGDITGGGEVHGSGCAEIVLDVAQNTSLCHNNFNDSLSYGNSFVNAIAEELSPKSLFKDSSLIRTYVDEEGREIDLIAVPGRPPEERITFKVTSDIELMQADGIINEVPAFDWSYGCAATSAAMMFGYYDRTGYPDMYEGPANGGLCPLNNSYWGSGECPLSATHMGYDGLAKKGHVDDYWISYGSEGPDPWVGNWEEHVHGNCTADFMGTNQWMNYSYNTDGGTIFAFNSSGAPTYDYQDYEPSLRLGCHGIRLFIESRGYNVTHDGDNYQNYNQYIKEYKAEGFTFEDFQSEIDAGRPVLIHVEGHTMLGYGYNDTSNLIYLHDTWDHNSHSMVWGDYYDGMIHYGVTVIKLESVPTPVHNLNTIENFITIQAAIDDSNTTNGDVIEVDSGTYSENIVVNKSLTIRSSSADPIDTIIRAAYPTKHLINATSDYVNISGFTLRDTNAGLKAGVYLGSGINNCNISNNFLTNNTYSGIYLDNSSDNTISGNNCTSNSYGIFLFYSSDNNTVTGNTCSGGDVNGIYLYDSNNNSISNNSVTNNSFYGIRLAGALSGSDNNTLTGNNASANLLFDFYSDEKSENNEIIDFTLSGDNPTTISFTYGNGIKIKTTDSAPAGPTSYSNISKYVNAINLTASSWLSINMSYDYSDISGFNESTLRIFRHNSTDWSEVNGSGVNTSLNYVFANITEFSTFAPMGIPLPNITSFSPSSNVSDFVGSTRSFNISVDQDVNVSWLLNGTQIQVNATVTTANYTNTSAAYGIWNITAVANNQYDEDQQTWIWNVTEDTTGPTISNLSPVNGSFINGSSHLVSANFSDASGINTSLTTIYVDSVNVTSNATITDSYLVYNQSSNYSDDLHNVTVNITDDSVNRNIASVTWNFTVDNVVPQTNITSGPSGTIEYNDLSFAWAGSDNQSQTSSLQYSYRLDGSWSSWTTDTSKSYTDLSNGDYTFSVKARDQAGNEDHSPANRSFTVSVPTPTATPTGGGGGGGGSSPSGNLQTDNSGYVKSTAIISSEDGVSMITIPEGTTALDGNGKSLKLVTISPISLDGTLSAFNYGPEGATFVPDVTIKIKFDPNDLSKGDTVVIKVFDGVEWTSLETSVDFTENTATAKVSHFSIFALFIIDNPKIDVMAAFDTASQAVSSDSNNSSILTTSNESSPSHYLNTLGIVITLALISAAVIGLYLHRKEGVRAHSNEHN
ncbi:MAG: NosD domain-containing protein [Halobacteriota archaeon]|nr:NosD domain-containing protein [Halobacteriota archaeon]